MKNFILKHKDINVLKFSFNENYEVENILAEYNIQHEPINVLYTTSKTKEEALRYWWEDRTIPANRDGLAENLPRLNVETTKKLLFKSFGLGLTDHYWIMPEDAELKWHSINYYENPFSADVGRILFDNDYYAKDINTFSPDNSSDGVSKKKWIIEENGERSLVKGGDIYAPQKPFNEVIAAEVCQRLNISHAPYQVFSDDQKKVFYVKGQNYTSEKTEFINANHSEEG